MTHGTLFADLAWLDPRNFEQIRTTTLPNNALEVLSRCLIRFDKSATVDNLVRAEMFSRTVEQIEGISS